MPVASVKPYVGLFLVYTHLRRHCGIILADISALLWGNTEITDWGLFEQNSTFILVGFLGIHKRFRKNALALGWPPYQRSDMSSEELTDWHLFGQNATLILPVAQDATLILPVAPARCYIDLVLVYTQTLPQTLWHYAG